MSRSIPTRRDLAPLLDDIEATHRRVAGVAGTTFDPHILSDPDDVLDVLAQLPHRDGRFLEWGSAIGLVTLLAAAVGFEAHGIEVNARLVDEADELARRHALDATFAQGSFIPSWYEPNPEVLGDDLAYDYAGADGYDALGVPLDDFDVIFAFAWPGDEAFLFDLFERGARAGATLIVNLGSDGMRIHHHGDVT